MTDTPADTPQSLQRTPLYDAHIALGARMVPFAGYEMPVQYRDGILKEHAATREHAGLFDISHMGQAFLIAEDGTHETVAQALEALTPADVLSLAPGEQRYSQLLNADGGIIDDLMVTRTRDHGSLFLVVNASRKAADYEVIGAHLPGGVRLEPRPDLALIAIQGPEAGRIIAANCPEAGRLVFMQATRGKLFGIDCHLSRSGYTGEDGFEISVAADNAGALWAGLMGCEGVFPCGLGARDSLRLEAGLCLYGHELDETISPIEAALSWSIPKRRRSEGGFPGADRVARELNEGVRRIRVGILPEGRAPARDGTEILSASGEAIGIVSSGGFSPTLKRPVAMGYVQKDWSTPGTPLKLVVRGSKLDASVVKLPFVAHRYHRST